MQGQQKAESTPSSSFGALLSLLLPGARPDGGMGPRREGVSHLSPKVVLSSSRTLFSFTCSSFRESLASGSSCKKRKAEQGPGASSGAGGPAPCQEWAAVTLGPAAAKSGVAEEPSAAPACHPWQLLGQGAQARLGGGWGQSSARPLPNPALKRATPPALRPPLPPS